MIVRMFTDGACSNNPGPGGYAALITTTLGTKTIMIIKNKTFFIKITPYTIGMR